MTVGVQAVLRAQGMPVSAPRRPGVVAAAEWALRGGLPLLVPESAVRRIAIEKTSHARIHLAGGRTLSGVLPAAQLAGAREVFVVAATVGDAIGNSISGATSEHPSRALALEGVAIAGLESWVTQLRNQLQALAAREGLHLTASISPGMEGWPSAPGQRDLFAVLGDGGPVRLLDSGMMWPRHSLSFVAGIGPDLANGAGPCDWCGARAHCRHRPVPGH